jgi:spore germination protein
MHTATLPRRAFGLAVALVLGLGVLPFAGLVPDPLATDPSLVATGIRARVSSHVHLTQQVYGYLPYWELNSSTAASLRYDLLTTIALFGIGIGADGNLDRERPGYAAYFSANAVDVVNAAHARGVRVVPTFQLFDSAEVSQLRAFLAHPAAQRRFIAQALSVIGARRADGANLDVEPLPASLAKPFAAFVGRFRSALKKEVPGATLVIALGAGVSGDTIEVLVPVVDQLFLMAYDYRTAGSTSAGPVAPLDAPWLSVRSDLARYLRHAPPGKVILGMPAYGYDWPVQSQDARSPVRTDAKQVGTPFSRTFSSVVRFLALHPGLAIRYDAAAGSPYFTYHDHAADTYRQVWFEDDRSLGRKVDLALAARLAGVGIWALDDAAEFASVWNLLRDKLRTPTHRVLVRGSLFHLALRDGRVVADISTLVQNRGNVPELGQLGWAVRDNRGRVVASGSVELDVESHGARRPLFQVVLGSAAELRTGTYRLTLVYGAGGRHWKAALFAFRQRY